MTVEDRLEISLILMEDSHELFTLVDSNRIYLREWLPWLDGTKSIEDENSFISMSLEDFEKREGAFYAIRLDGSIIGTISLNWIDWENNGCGVGYWLSENQTGNGYVTKCCIRLMEHCFEDLKIHRFVLESGVENHSSRAVADRLGMRLEGIIKDREWLYDHYVDAALYAITAPEWSPSN
tara:strand:+ start:19004 stop:19543 length:540 start_codon:yes stop_codon:yes gene_type:complete